MGRKAAGTLKELRPDIASQLVHKELADVLSVGSNESVEWICDKGHVWTAKVYNRTNPKHSTGCPVCDGKQVLPGFNDLATTDPEVAQLCFDPTDATKYLRNSNIKLKWKCEKGHVWDAPVSRLITQGSRCPYCAGRLPIVGESDLATLYPEIADELVDQSLRTKLRPGSNKKLEWRCAHGHIWKATVYDRTGKKNNCPYCSGRNPITGETDLTTTHPQLVEELVDKSLAHKLKAGSDAKVEWQCRNNPAHHWFSTVSNRARMGSGCPVCANKTIIPGENDILTTHPYLRDWVCNVEEAQKVPAGSSKKIHMQCKDDPSHVWEESAYHLTNGEAIICPLCAGHHRSKGELELEQTIKELLPGVAISSSDHTICDGNREIDIVVPSRGVAFEFNGVRWHCEAYQTDRNYHLQKFLDCEKEHLQLIQVWDDDWRFRKDVVIRMVAAKLQATNNLPNVTSIEFDPKTWEHIGARNCSIVLVPGKEAVVFLDANHIQGKVTATYHFALIDDDGDIRALLSLRSPKNNARMHRNEGEWEIQRYATKGVVSGGFSRLLKFAKNYIVDQGHCLTTWISFSANDVSDGSMYEKSGFKKIMDVKPDYKYVGNLTRMIRTPKEKFQKKAFQKSDKLLYEEGLTEIELAHLNQLSRIFDAGKKKWVKSAV